jgi:hypothetical protein
MDINRILKFSNICKYYFAPLESLYPLFYKHRDYKLYFEIVKLFISFYREEKDNTAYKNLSNKFYNLLDKKTKNSLFEKLDEFVVKYRDNNPFEYNNKHIVEDKINQIINTLAQEKEYIKIPENILKQEVKFRLTHSEKILESSIIDFIEYFKKILEYKNNKKQQDIKVVIFIASVEFFNAMHHISVCTNSINKEQRSKNLSKSINHLQRATRDMKKLDLYIINDVTLDSFKDRIQEIINTGIEE